VNPPDRVVSVEKTTDEMVTIRTAVKLISKKTCRARFSVKSGLLLLHISDDEIL